MSRDVRSPGDLDLIVIDDLPEMVGGMKLERRLLEVMNLARLAR